MSSVVTPKGQVVVAMGIRDSLSIASGWVSLQRLADDHVDIYFVPPEHREPLKGALAPYIRTHVPPGDEWRDMKERAWNDAVRARPVTRPRSK